MNSKWVCRYMNLKVCVKNDTLYINDYYIFITNLEVFLLTLKLLTRLLYFYLNIIVGHICGNVIV